ncbi:MAG: hypothetical protein PHY47_01335 [Lachnospiraceae bacterium]|nr:hypothetical protein [Lachnospiraceae bacterium]
MNSSTKALSDVIVFTKYAKYQEELGRRETYEEIVNRNKNMHKTKFANNPEILNKIDYYYDNFVLTKKVLPSMRSMQFAGKPIEVNPARIFNCAFAPADHYKIFSEAMFLLLGGTGLGYSVQTHHVDKLPAINPPTKKRRYLVGDSIEGWADAVKILIEAYMKGKSLPIFDFSDIRAKGERLVTSGGKAPGPQPLKDCLHNLKKILDSKKPGSKLTTLEVHDMICYIADAVLAGGIRRAALICLFSMDDYDMLTCKSGNWWELNPQRGRANNSAVIIRHRVKEDDFKKMWKIIEESRSGEPGFYFSNNAEWGTNPCVEIGLRANQFCNLVETNGNDVVDQKDANERAEAASFIATLQASYTDFHYLRDIWKRTTEKDALIGASWTGIASGALDHVDLEEAALYVARVNEETAKLIGINPAARTTCVKPAGTTSLVLGCSSGIHGWHAPYYIRRVRLGKNEAIYQYLNQKLPALIEDEFFNPKDQAVVSFPVKAPETAKFRTESPLELLERVRRFSEHWVTPGHRNGDNGHNVSATISLKDDEWEEVGNWMWKNREVYNGLSVLPYDGGTYKQAPFEDITKERYEEMLKYVQEIDLSEVLEVADNTDLKGEAACAGGICEISF